MWSQSLTLLPLTKTIIKTSVVTFARGIFTERHYDKRKFDPTEMKEPFSFEKFLDQKPVDERKAARQKSDRGVWTLNRATSPKADKFLDMLHEYVFEGIKLRALDAFELHLYEDPKRRDQVLERWTFQISYPDGARDLQLDVHLQQQGKTPVKIMDAQERLRDTVRSIGLLANDMINLPRKLEVRHQPRHTPDCLFFQTSVILV